MLGDTPKVKTCTVRATAVGTIAPNTLTKDYKFVICGAEIITPNNSTAMLSLTYDLVAS